MKQKTVTGRIKEVSTAPYKVDWDGEQGSDFSAEILDFLEPYWRHDVVLAEWPVAGTKLRYDYVNLTRRIIVECDGVQHNAFNAHFHGLTSTGNSRDPLARSPKYLKQIKNDQLKDKIAHLNDFLMIRILPKDLPLTKEWFKSAWDLTL